MHDPKDLRNIHALRLISKIQSHVFWKQTETYTLKVYSSRKKISWLQKANVKRNTATKC